MIQRIYKSKLGWLLHVAVFAIGSDTIHSLTTSLEDAKSLSIVNYCFINYYSLRINQFWSLETHFHNGYVLLLWILVYDMCSMCLHLY